MIKGNKTDALIFDMDGTLWDAVETYAESWNVYFAKHQIDKHFTKAKLEPYMGLEEAAFFEKVFPESPVDIRKKMYDEVVDIQYKLIEETGGELYEGMVDGLEALSKKYKIFIVSNCPEHTIKYFMKWAKIEPFVTDTLAHGENFRPKFENIQFLVKKHSLKNAVYIGDTASDCIQSKKANVPFIFVDYGFGVCTDYDKKFSSFTELKDYFLSWRN